MPDRLQSSDALQMLTSNVEGAMDSLDGALEQACLSLCQAKFDAAVYRKVLDAYDLLRQLPMLQVWRGGRGWLGWVGLGGGHPHPPTRYAAS